MSTWGLTSTLLGLFSGQGGGSGYTANTEIYSLNYFVPPTVLILRTDLLPSNLTSIITNTQAIIPQMLPMC